MSPLPQPSSPEETLAYIAQHIMDKQTMQEAMKEAVAEGIRAVVSDPATWSAAGAAMQQRAQSTAGGWLFSGIRAVFSKAGMIVMLLVGMGMVGGWQGFLAALKALGGGHAP